MTNNLPIMVTKKIVSRDIIALVIIAMFFIISLFIAFIELYLIFVSGQSAIWGHLLWLVLSVYIGILTIRFFLKNLSRIISFDSIILEQDGIIYLQKNGVTQHIFDLKLHWQTFYKYKEDCEIEIANENKSCIISSRNIKEGLLFKNYLDDVFGFDNTKIDVNSPFRLSREKDNL